MNPTFRRHDRCAGLTVLELVSALALFVIIIGLLMVALNAATDVWKLSSDKNSNLQKARRALDWIATDLASAVAPQTQKVRDGANALTPGTATQPLFVEKGDANQVGLFFIRTLSPVERTEADQVSLEFVAYHWTTNGLSRYTRPVKTETTRTNPPDLAEQMRQFRTDFYTVTTPSNILSSTIVGFEPRLYQPLGETGSTIASKPAYIDPGSDGEINLADLPDFADIYIAYVNPDEGPLGYCTTNYLTRRVTLPASLASRLP